MSISDPFPWRKPLRCGRRALEAAAGVALACLGLTACGGRPMAPPPMGPPAVTVMTVQAQPVTLEADLPGRTNPYQVSDVRPQISGIIQARLFQEGSDVRAGQLLYRIDPAPYQAAYDQAVAQLANARAVLGSARLKAARYADMVKINAVSQQDADDAKAASDEADASVKQQQAAVESARINLAYTRVTAPIGGRIGASSFTQGALVSNGQTSALATIQKLDPIYVDVTQTAVELLGLKDDIARTPAKGGDARGALVRLRLGDGRDYPIEGRLQFTDVTVDQNTGSVTLRAIFPNPKGVLLPGMYVRAKVTEGVDANGILAPQQAVSRDEKGQPIAMVVDAQGLAQARMLTLAGAVGNQWRVTGGLRPGDRLIVVGAANAKSGQPVKVMADQTPTSTPAS
jgi:membrane fusion protein (multidrug efflux system)